MSERDDDDVVVFSDTQVPAVGTLTSIELERPARLGQSRVERVDVENELVGPTLGDLPAVIARKADSDSGELETTSHVPGEYLVRASGLGGEQHVARQVEEPCDFVPPGNRVARPILRGGRQIAGDDRHHEE